MNYLKKATLIFPILFVVELVFGFSGTMVMIHGVAIRHILFILTFISLYGYFFAFLYKNKIRLFSLKQDSYFGSYSKIDICAIVFEVSTLLSMTLIPWLMGTDLHYAYSEVFDSAAIFSLYFPLSFLFKKKEYSMDRLLEFLKYLIFLFAVMHLLFYFEQEMNPNFIQGIFDGISSLLHGNSITPRVILGHGGYTRVMFTTSIYLIVGIYIYLKQLDKFTWYNILIFIVDILAIITTVTKSLWFGIIIALVVYLLTMIIAGRKNKKILKRVVISCITAVVVVVVSNSVLFNHIFSIRMSNAFVADSTYTEDEYETDENGQQDAEDEIEKLDREGAAESNQIKIEQVKMLTEKWLQAPIFGWGYGSYVEDYLRSEEAPFSYEMQAFALLMKIGIVGLGIWGVFFVLQIISMVKNNKDKNVGHMAAWLFMLVAMAVCVQTNPLLISFTGMSVVLLISLIAAENALKKESNLK